MLVTGGAGSFTTAALGAAFLPFLVLALAGTRTAVWLLVLVVAVQLTGLHLPLGGYRFLPEHLAVVLFAASLLVSRPAALIRRPAPYEALFLAWIGWNGVVSVLYAPDPAQSLEVVGWMLLAWLVLWCTKGYMASDPDQAERVLDAGVGVGAALGWLYFGLWVLALSGVATLWMQPEYVTGTVGARGMAYEANLLGSQLLCWLFLRVRARLLRNQRIPPWQAVGLALGILATMTRAVWLALAVVVVGTALVARLHEPGRRRMSVNTAGRWLVAGSIALCLVAVFGAPAVDKLTGILDFESVTGQSRRESWSTGWEDVTTSGSYLTGLGTNSYGQRHYSPTLPGEPDYLGNLPLVVLYDSGVVGVVLLGSAFAALVLRGKGSKWRLTSLVFVAALVVAGAGTNPIWFGFVWLTLATLDPDVAPRPESGRAPVLAGRGDGRSRLPARHEAGGLPR